MNGLDYVILGVSLLTVLIIGWTSGRKSQNKTQAAFLLADRGINKLQAGFSMAATDFGGSGLVGAIGYCYLVGISGAWWNLAAAPAFLLVGLLLSRKFYNMDGATLPEYFGKRYGMATRYLASSMQILASLAGLAVQFTVSSTVLYVITGIPMNVALVISILIVLFLTSGGLRAVVNTDATLFIIIVLSVFLAAGISVKAAGGYSVMAEQLPSGFLRIDQLGAWTPLSWMLLCILSYSTNQMYIQRMVAAKDEGTATFGALFTAGFYLVISFALGLIGVAASVLIPGIEDTNAIFPSILLRFFPHGLVGLGLAAVFAATISTGTSVLHATATLFINDLYTPLWGKTKSDRTNLTVSRVSVVVIALFALTISLFSSNIVNIVYIGGLFYSVSAFMPMVLGLYTKFVTGKAALISMIVTVILSLIWEYFPNLHGGIFAAFPSNFFGIIVSCLTLCIFSLLMKRTKHKNEENPHI